MSNLYIGNLSYEATEEDLQDLFDKHAEVESAKVVRDRETNKSRGFGFVTLCEDSDMDSIIEELDGRELRGRNIVVKKARERQYRPGDKSPYREKRDQWRR